MTAKQKTYTYTGDGFKKVACPGDGDDNISLNVNHCG